MSEFLIYLLKLNFILSVLFAFYYWVLRKETFYTSNRINFFERSLTVYSNGSPSKIALYIQGTVIK